MSLSSYLASKYLTASPAPSSSSTAKKRKRKTPSSTPGLIIADDDDLGWSKTPTAQDDDDAPQAVTSGSAEFRKAKKSAWKTVGVPALQPQDSEQDEADRIIKEAAEEGRERQENDGPVIENDGVVKMGDGTHAGLQSAAAVAAQFAKRKKKEAEAWARESGSKKGKKGAAEETVYRDATGRRIDISLRRAEARRELDEKARKELEEIEEQKGDVQRLQKEKRREELDEARFMPLARTVDDVDMNAELKERERWNDPAAQFLAPKKATKSRTGKPIYKGSWAPNRYGIAPGHRWDGVDRGNGWEGERFTANNRATRNKDLDFAWQMDE
jgi:pre-mRNA-splicing factor CWC26